MTPPIKPGTARRLGLRKPEPRPQAILKFPKAPTEEEVQAIAERFREAAGRPVHVLHDDPEPPKSFFDQWYDPSITGTFAGPGGYPVNPVPWWRRLFRREKS